MEVGDADWERLIADGAGAFGVVLSGASLAGFSLYARELLLWNRRMNLTRIVAPEDVAIKHMVDSLSLCPHLPLGARVADIGSGGGFPGIPLKLARTDLRITLVESVGKKASFLKHVVRVLELGNVEVRQGRAEVIGKAPGLSGAFDAVVCRAVSSLAEGFFLAVPFLREGGRFLSLKAETTEEEILALRDRLKGKGRPFGGDAKALSIETAAYPLTGAFSRRTVVKVRLGGAAACG